MLRDAARDGVWVSSHPDTILALGTKEVLYRTRQIGWSTDTDLYRTSAELRERFPARLTTGTRVLKQGRGTGGQGVWRVDLAGTAETSSSPTNAQRPAEATLVRIEHALARGDGEVAVLPLTDFLRRSEDYFAWSGCIVDQAYHPRLAEGMIRCYLSLDEVVGFYHQYPRALRRLRHSTRAQQPVVRQSRASSKGALHPHGIPVANYLQEGRPL